MDSAPHRHPQLPTHGHLKLVTSSDAKAALFVVEAGLLPPVRRRPDESEKGSIGHGHVYIWIDGAKGETGLERWTDGRSWGPSRCRDDFLIYEEKTGEHRLTKCTYTARRNTHGDPGALWHLIAYYYADQTHTLTDLATDAHFKQYTSQMPTAYFVSSRKDKSRKAKEVPARVEVSPLSRYDEVMANIQSAATPTSPSYHSHSAGSRSPPMLTHSSPPQPHQLIEPISFNGNGSSTNQRLMSNGQQRRNELAPLDTRFDARHNYQHFDARRAAAEGTFSAHHRHTAHDPKTYKPVLAQDYHRLPPPGQIMGNMGGGDSREGSAPRAMGSVRGGAGVVAYSPPSPSSESSSPGLSPVSSVSDGERDTDMDMDVTLPAPADYHARYHHHPSAYERDTGRVTVKGIVAPTPVRPSSVSHLQQQAVNGAPSFLPATPRSAAGNNSPRSYVHIASPVPPMHFDHDGDAMMIDGGVEAMGQEEPSRSIIDETAIQAFNSQLQSFF